MNEINSSRQIALRAGGAVIAALNSERRNTQRLALMAGKRVLLADDLGPVLIAVNNLVRDSFEVIGMVSDGQAALDSILALNPDLVVLDISMPRMSGIEVARELKRRGNKTKVVFLTVHEDSDILATCLSVGGLGYVVKVAMESDLIPAMNDALADRPFVSRFSSGQDALNDI